MRRQRESLSGICCISAYADVIRVPSEYPTIQAGIDAAVEGDTVLVEAGTYSEHLDFEGKNILVKGEFGADSTIIERLTSGIPLVRFENGETSDAILSGFTLRLTDNAPAINISGSGPSIINNEFLANDRGGIHAEDSSSPRVLGNIFVNNSSPGGGAIYCSESAVFLSGNQFIANSVSNNGGAVYLWDSDGSIIHHNLFYQNQSHSMGGAICLSECRDIEFYNNTVAFNGTDQQYHGGGVTIWNSQNCHLYNNIIVNNAGEGILQEMDFTSTATYNDVWGNDDDYYGIDPGIGSISADPQFEEGAPYSFELMDNSPCIDAGDPSSPPDSDGSVADMGAFHYRSGPGPAVDIEDVTGGESGWWNRVNLYAYSLQNLDIAGLELHIRYDEEHFWILQFNSDYFSNALVNEDSGEVHILWDDYSNPFNLPDSGILMAIDFYVDGEIGDSCFIAWMEDNELVDPNGDPIANLNFMDGYIVIDEIVEIREENSTIPSSHYLKGNHPNPFNANTTIEFGLSNEALVNIRIYDILGNLVDTVSHDYYPAGHYSIPWDSDKYPSGTYFYKITAGDFSDVGKMSLIK